MESPVTQQVQQNIADGNVAREITALLASDNSLPLKSAHFWNRLSELARDQAVRLMPQPLILTPAEPAGPMSDEEAYAFSRQTMEFSHDFFGVPVGEVSADWLLAVTSDTKFKRQLKRYVQSNYFQRLLEE